MSLDVRYVRFRVRGRPADKWTSSDEVLLDRELGLETDTRKFKFGDGVTPWSGLKYASSGGGGGSAWHNGSGAPSDSLGEDGDYYLDNNTGDVYQKDLGTYSQVANIKGPSGEDGADSTVPGPSGDSAYQVAVNNGFMGTQAEWLDSLVGPPGADSTVPGPPGNDAVGAAVRGVASFSEGTGTIAVGKVALLIAIETDAPARIRLYATAAARAADASRPAGTDAAQGAGLLLEFISTAGLLAAPLTPGVVAHNEDTTPTGVVYYNVQPAGASSDVAVTYLKLET